MGKRRWSKSHSLTRAVKLSEGLFDPKMKLRWRVAGGRVELRRAGKPIWDWGRSFWHGCYPTHQAMAEFLLAYINTPLDDLRERKINFVFSRFWHDKQLSGALEEAFHIMLASDRRLGQEIQSRFLFMTSNRHARNISVERTY
jgi:hypothetical protein